MAPIELIKSGERMTVYGQPKLNAALADGWQRVLDLTPEQQRELADRPPLPWTGYDSQTYQEVLAQSAGLPPERIKEIVVYESATKGRVTIIGKLTGNVPVQRVFDPTEDHRLEADDKKPAMTAEKQLEAETGRPFVKTGDSPPTFAETDAPAP